MVLYPRSGLAGKYLCSGRFNSIGNQLTVDSYKLKQDLFNHNVRCLSTISMHHMDLKLFFNLMLMIMSIGIQMKILENGLLIPWERDYM